LSSNVAGPPALSCMAVQAPTLKTDPKLRFEVARPIVLLYALS
jgi:hypothetical protein